MQSLEAKFFGEEKQQIQIKVSWGAKLEEKVSLYLFSRSIKMWCPSSSQIIVQCVIESLFMVIWWCYSDYLFQIYLIIIVLYVVIMVWGRYNLFFRSLGARGARRGLKRNLGPAFGESDVDLSHLLSWLYILAEHCASLVQPQYVDGLLNPSHRILSFTTNLYVVTVVQSVNGAASSHLVK